MNGEKTKKTNLSDRRILGINLIPKPLYGRNLRATIGQYRWRKLRRTLFANNLELRCETCGAIVEGPALLSAHEEWLYVTSKKPAVARLQNIRLICRPCHGCEHFGLTLILLQKGFLTWSQVEETIRHYCDVNRVSLVAFRRDLKRASTLWKKRSRRKWRVDFRNYSGLIEEKVLWKERIPARLRLNTARDSEPTVTSIHVRRGRKPLFGCPMTNAERQARYRHFKNLSKHSA